MKVVSRGMWRPFRWVLLLLSAGAVLAADNTWTSRVRFDYLNAFDWWSNISSREIANADIAAASAMPSSATPELSMGRLLNGLLFSKPSTGWRLAPEKSGSTSVWMAQKSGDSSSASSGGFWQPVFFDSGFVSGARSGPVPAAPTASGIWASNGSGNWSNSANWSAGVIADGAGNNASFDALNISTDVTVTLDTSRTMGSLVVGDTDGTHRYTIAPSGGSTLTFDNISNAATIQQTATSAGDTISVPIFFNGDSLVVTNSSTTKPLTISGNIASSGASGTFPFLSFEGNAINVSGNISNGTTGRTLNVSSGGTLVTFSGTNSYTGSTSVNPGVLLINGDNTAATGTLFVSGSGAILGGTGTVGGSVQTFDGTITGATTGTVGTLTLLKSVNLSTGEGSGTYWADLSGNMSDLLAITGDLNLGQGSILDIHGVGDGFTTYTLATFGSRDDVFGSVMGVPGGYSLVYHDTDIQLVPIPEPATWIGGAMTLGAIWFFIRSRQRSASA